VATLLAVVDDHLAGKRGVVGKLNANTDPVALDVLLVTGSIRSLSKLNSASAGVPESIHASDRLGEQWILLDRLLGLGQRAARNPKGQGERKTSH
jgi:hypothetical protein